MKKFFLVKKSKINLDRTYKIFQNEIKLFYDGDVLKAFSSYCPHFGGPLNYKDNNFYCHWHGYNFNKAGKCISHNIKLNVIFFKITIENGNVYIWEN